MKPSASRIERMLAKAEAALGPPERKCLVVIVHEGDDEAAAMEKALADMWPAILKMPAARFGTSDG